MRPHTNSAIITPTMAKVSPCGSVMRVLCYGRSCALRAARNATAVPQTRRPPAGHRFAPTRFSYDAWGNSEQGGEPPCISPKLEEALLKSSLDQTFPGSQGTPPADV